MTNYLLKRNSADDLFDAFDSFFAPTERVSAMRTDIKQTDNDFRLEIELAGFEKEEINLAFENGILTVSAEKKATEEKDGYLRQERLTKVRRSYRLGEVNQDAIKAKYVNGILEVTVPKKEIPTPRAITID